MSHQLVITKSFENCITVSEFGLLAEKIEKAKQILENKRRFLDEDSIEAYNAWIESLIEKLAFIKATITSEECVKENDLNIKKNIERINQYKNEIANGCANFEKILENIQLNENKTSKPVMPSAPVVHVAAKCNIINGKRVITTTTYFV